MYFCACAHLFFIPNNNSWSNFICRYSVFYLVPLSWEGKWTFFGGIEDGSRNFWGGQTKFFIRKLRASLVEGEATNWGLEAPENRGRSPSRRREAPENWGRSPNRGRSPRKIGEEVWGGGSVSPSPENLKKIHFETIHFGAYLSQTFEINDNMPDSRQCSIAYIHEKIDIKYLMSGNCLILMKFKTW